MFIKYTPRSERAQKAKLPAGTNLGEFMPGRVGGPYTREQDIHEAKRLVKNGEFVECAKDGSSLDAPKPAPPAEAPKSKK